MSAKKIFKVIGVIFFEFLFCGACVWVQGSNSKENGKQVEVPNKNIIKEAYYVGKNFTVDTESNFNWVYFNSTADFGISRFNSMALFWHTHFGSTTDFGVTRFNSITTFDSAHFFSTVSFKYARFNSITDFTHTRFDSIAYFDSAYFNLIANFGAAHFNSIANFRGACFDSTANFRGAYFKSAVNFQNASLNGECDFNLATLPDTLDFRNITKIKIEIDFTTARLDSTKKKRCIILLTGTDISKVKINMQLFEIGFTDDESYEQRTSVYEKLLAKFKQEGFEESYRLLDIDYRRYKLLHDGLLLGKFLNLLQTYWWNYGYNKEWILTKWTSRAILFFTVFNLFWLSRLQSGIYNLEFVAPILRDAHHWWAKRHYFPRRAFLQQGVSICAKYVLATLVYTSMIFFRLKIELEKSNIRKHPWLFLYTLILYTIGLICTGFIANVIFTK